MNHKENDTYYIRLSEILTIIPISKSTWWRKVKTGEYPQPIKFGERIRAWKASEVYAIAENLQGKFA